jgi:hypothetical protein
VTFHAGQSGDIGGVRWRVVRGSKSLRDLRLEIQCPRFVAVKMDLGFLFSDFYAQNERTLSEDGYLARSVATRSGERYLNYLKGAQVLGWEIASEQLAEERARKRAAWSSFEGSGGAAPSESGGVEPPAGSPAAQLSLEDAA